MKKKRLGIKGTVPHFQTNPAGDSENKNPIESLSS